MNTRTSYTLVGLFVLGLGAALVAGILWLGSGSAGRHYHTYVVYMTESVSGLSRDGVVKYRGVDVGRVREIRLDPDDPEQVRLLLDIEEGTPIKEDTVATLEVRGLTGLAYVNLAGGSRSAPPLSTLPDQPWPVIPSRPSVWGRLDRNIGTLLENLVDASRQLRGWLSDENRDLVMRTVANLETLSGALAQQSDRLGDASDDLLATLGYLRRASEQAPALVDDLRRTARAFEQTAHTFEATGSHLDRVIAARDRELVRFTANTLPETAAMVTDLRRTAANLRRFSAQLKRDPAILLRGAPPVTPGPGEQEPQHR